LVVESPLDAKRDDQSIEVRPFQDDDRRWLLTWRSSVVGTSPRHATLPAFYATSDQCLSESDVIAIAAGSGVPEKIAGGRVDFGLLRSTCV
jgi:hypothetical protein